MQEATAIAEGRSIYAVVGPQDSVQAPNGDSAAGASAVGGFVGIMTKLSIEKACLGLGGQMRALLK